MKVEGALSAVIQWKRYVVLNTCDIFILRSLRLLNFYVV